MTYFGVWNLENTSAVRVIFFSKCLKLDLDYKNEQKTEKKFFVIKIIASEDVAINCVY